MSRPTREQVARALFWRDTDPGDDAVGERLWKNISERTGGDSEWHRAADAVLALFPEQPRETVTTAAELDALPVGSVVRDEDGAIFQRFNTGLWFAPQTIPGTTSVDLARNNTHTVIHRPEETP